MRLSQSLETEETKRQERGLEFYNWRWTILALALAAMPSAFVWTRQSLDQTIPLWLGKFVALLLIPIVIAGSFYVYFWLPRKTPNLSLDFPEIDKALILYEYVYLASHMKIMITSDEIWQQNHHLPKLFGVYAERERRIAKRDIMRIKTKRWFGNTYYNIYYRTFQGEKKLSLRRERDDNLETALYTNVTFAEVSA